MLPISSQNARSLETRNVLNQFLASDLTNLVESYLAHSDATEVLVLGTDGRPVDSELNRTTSDAIKLALTSPTCDRDIIRLIFQQAAENGYKAFLNVVMNELREQKKPIILDKVDFSGIDLSFLKFDGASMVNANFAGANLDVVELSDTDLTGIRGLASATGIISISHQTILNNTELARLAETFIIGTYFKPCLIALLNEQESAVKKSWNGLETLMFSYSRLVELLRLEETSDVRSEL